MFFVIFAYVQVNINLKILNISSLFAKLEQINAANLVIPYKNLQTICIKRRYSKTYNYYYYLGA